MFAQVDMLLEGRELYTSLCVSQKVSTKTGSDEESETDDGDDEDDVGHHP